MPKTNLQLIDRVEDILGDQTNAIFSPPSISAQLQDDLREISIYVPNVVDHWLVARRASRYVDVSARGGILDVNYAVWPVLLVDTSGNLRDDWDIDNNRRNVVYEGLNVRMDLTNAPTPTQTDTLTGTVTFNDGSTAVSGSSTLFTTELKAGRYIKKSGSSTWYRVSSVTDATNLVLASTCATADDGADTADATVYWRADVLVNCDQIHHLTTQSDLEGKVNTAHAKGVWQMAVNNLGTGTMDENLMFTIAGVDGVYRVTEDATINTNAATIYFEPALEGLAAHTAVVTFVGSSLTPRLETILPDLCAGHLAIDWVGDGRAAIVAATAFMATGDDLLNKLPTAAGAQRDYLAYTTAKLNIANSLASYTQWGWNKLQRAVSELEDLVVPKQYIDYPRG